MLLCEDVSYRYGDTEALNSVSLSTSSRRVALLGPNGAGKSTLLSLLVTAKALQTGNIELAGWHLAERADRESARRFIGYVPQSMTLPPSWTCEELLAYACWMHGAKNYQAQVAQALKQVDLAERATSKIAALSGGMRQRLCIAQALVHEPSILVVDEATVGLDPLQRVNVREVLGRLDCHLLLATHLVDDVAAIGDWVVILDQGSVTFSGPLDELCSGRPTSEAVEAGYLRHVSTRERA